MTTYQEISAQFYSNRLLFGDPADPGIVAVEIASRNEIDVYKRIAGTLTRERRPLKLFLLVDDTALLSGFNAPHQTRELAGGFRYRILVTLESLHALETARRHLRNNICQLANDPGAPDLVLAEPPEQPFMRTGARFFFRVCLGHMRQPPPH